nr:semaphorin-5B-like [Oncorhynchus nerka]
MGGNFSLRVVHEFRTSSLVCVCPVKGTWSCWASWSHCSATCGGGHYQRTRTCSNPAPTNGGDICIGLHTEEALCNTHTCEGGRLPWSEWGECDEEGLQHRSRECGEREADPSLCQGNATASRPCQPPEVPVVLPGQDNDQRCGGK